MLHARRVLGQDIAHVGERRDFHTKSAWCWRLSQKKGERDYLGGCELSTSCSTQGAQNHVIATRLYNTWKRQTYATKEPGSSTGEIADLVQQYRTIRWWHTLCPEKGRPQKTSGDYKLYIHTYIYIIYLTLFKIIFYDIILYYFKLHIIIRYMILYFILY